MLDDFGTERSAEDILAGRLRLRLAGEWYTLPVLTVGQNADWLASLEVEFAALAEQPDDDLPAIVQLLSAVDDKLLDFIYSYDVTNALPPKDTIERKVYPHEVLRAVMEVRLAANPTVAYGLALAVEAVRAAQASTEVVQRSAAALKKAAGSRSSRTSSSRRRTAGTPRKSVAN